MTNQKECLTEIYEWMKKYEITMSSYNGDGYGAITIKSERKKIDFESSSNTCEHSIDSESLKKEIEKYNE